MKFIDRTKIAVKAGDGGHGKSAFRHEKFIPKGGPSGGDGGKGADIIFVVDTNINTLLDFRYNRKFIGNNGGNGDIKNQFGRNAPDLIIKVPAGTIIKDEDTGEILADLTKEDDTAIICKGGRGGRGNARFSNSANRAPSFAELGEPGSSRKLVLELKVLADVGLVGYPSVGKSSLISSVSAARPQIAEYHFTTLNPILGVVRVGPEENFVMADLPGLIDGAAKGVGLGHDFLRHIERTKILIHVVDASGIEGRDPVEDFHKINNELSLYSDKLPKLPQILAANKIDLPEAQENLVRLRQLAQEKNLPFFEISAATKQGVDDLVKHAYTMLINYQEPEEEPVKMKVYDAAQKQADEIIKVSRDMSGDFVVSGKSIEKLVAMTNFANDEALRRFQYIWRLKQIDAKLRDKGIKEGDLVHIGDMEFEFKD
ncbi:GTPase ObgE [Pectinatus brassicae]|uniref:GTPase Obg n=1 Tax=Pectinatus brassicae TaxID=862415 RepID=A0A840UHM6_9FIRM|nr:GTPase ObgE [Pectinatus brassicae]MBB5337241.1 GTP-binding protein [Pectinatus brassicae]